MQFVIPFAFFQLLPLFNLIELLFLLPRSEGTICQITMSGDFVSGSNFENQPTCNFNSYECVCVCVCVCACVGLSIGFQITL